MTEGLLEQLKGLDPAILTNIARKDQNDPSFQITEMKREL